MRQGKESEIQMDGQTDHKETHRHTKRGRGSITRWYLLCTAAFANGPAPMLLRSVWGHLEWKRDCTVDQTESPDLHSRTAVQCG